MKKPAEKKPKQKTVPKPKLSDEERHARFVAAAREVEADESAGSFDAAFKKVVQPRRSRQG